MFQRKIRMISGLVAVCILLGMTACFSLPAVAETPAKGLVDTSEMIDLNTVTIYKGSTNDSKADTDAKKDDRTYGTWTPDLGIESDNGKGTKYKITDRKGMEVFAAIVSTYTCTMVGNYVYLANDIDMEWENFSGIGQTGASENGNIAFKGTFDGNGFVIKNLLIDQPDHYRLGLFNHYYGGNGGAIRNVGIANGLIIGGLKYTGAETTKNFDGVGSLVGDCWYGTVENCWSAATVISSCGAPTGGLIGRSYRDNTAAVMNNCYFLGTVNGVSATATYGLSGEPTNIIASSCYILGQDVTAASLNGNGLANKGLTVSYAANYDVKFEDHSAGYPVFTYYQAGKTTPYIQRVPDQTLKADAWNLNQVKAGGLYWTVDDGGDLVPAEESERIHRLMVTLNKDPDTVFYRYGKAGETVDLLELLKDPTATFVPGEPAVGDLREGIFTFGNGDAHYITDALYMGDLAVLEELYVQNRAFWDRKGLGKKLDEAFAAEYESRNALNEAVNTLAALFTVGDEIVPATLLSPETTLGNGTVVKAVAPLTDGNIKKVGIYSEGDLLAIPGGFGAGRTLYLCADLDLKNSSFKTINDFKGVFDGQNHTIRNFIKTDYGFFQSMDGTAVRNVVFEYDDGMTFNQAKGYSGVIFNDISVDCIFENITFRGGTFKSTEAGFGLMGASVKADATFKNILVENCKFSFGGGNQGVLLGRLYQSVTVTMQDIQIVNNTYIGTSASGSWFVGGFDDNSIDPAAATNESVMIMENVLIAHNTKATSAENPKAILFAEFYTRRAAGTHSLTMKDVLILGNNATMLTVLRSSTAESTTFKINTINATNVMTDHQTLANGAVTTIGAMTETYYKEAMSLKENTTVLPTNTIQNGMGIYQFNQKAVVDYTTTVNGKVVKADAVNKAPVKVTLGAADFYTYGNGKLNTSPAQLKEAVPCLAGGKTAAQLKTTVFEKDQAIALTPHAVVYRFNGDGTHTGYCANGCGNFTEVTAACTETPVEMDEGAVTRYTCDFCKNHRDHVNFVRPTGLGTDQKELTLSVGASYPLTYRVTPENADITKVIWTTSDPQVATVENGVVTPLRRGTAVITLKAVGVLEKDILELQYYLTVVDPDLEAAEAVDVLIRAIGPVTLSRKEAVEQARAAFEALALAQKPLVKEESLLKEAEAQLAIIIAADARLNGLIAQAEAVLAATEKSPLPEEEMPYGQTYADLADWEALEEAICTAKEHSRERAEDSDVAYNFLQNAQTAFESALRTGKKFILPEADELRGDLLYKEGVRINAYQLAWYQGKIYFTYDYHRILKGKTVYLSAQTVMGSGLEPGYYIFNDSGAMELDNGPKGDYFYQNGAQVKAYRLVEYNGDYYFVGDCHRLAKNKHLYLTAAYLEGAGATHLTTGYYDFDAEGKMIRYHGPKGDYFYQNGAQVKAYHLVCHNENYYFVNDGHRLAKNQRLYMTNETLAGTQLPAGYYEFDENGVMLLKNGPVAGIFYIKGVPQKAYRLYAFGEEFYYVGDGNRIVTDRRIYLSKETLAGTPFDPGYYDFYLDGRMVRDDRLTFVPDFGAMTEEEARAAAQKLPLQVNFDVTPYRLGNEGGRVMNQSIGKNELVPMGVSLTITVSGQPQSVAVPDFYGMTPAAAEKAANEAGFYLTFAQGFDPKVDRVGVSAQSTAAGTLLLQGNTLTAEGKQMLVAPLRVAQSNVQMFQCGELTNYDAAARQLEELDADIVSFTRVDQNAKRTFYADQMAEIGEAAGYPYRTFMKLMDLNQKNADETISDVGDYGMGLMSKFPFTATTHLFKTQAGTEPRGYIRAEVDLGRTTAVVYSVWTGDETVSAAQLTEIANRSKNEKNVVVTGNLGALSGYKKAIPAHLTSTNDGSAGLSAYNILYGNGFMPANAPVMQRSSDIIKNYGYLDLLVEGVQAPETVVVPNFKRMTPAQAKAAAEAAGFEVVLKESYHASYKDQVYKQAPAAGVQMPVGRGKISLTYSGDYSDHIKVVTYNIHHLWLDPDGKNGPKGEEDRTADVVQNLKDLDADVVLLQEVDVNAKRSAYVDQPKFLAETLGYPYYEFAHVYTLAAGGKYGTAILSRYEITDAETVVFDKSVQDTGSETRGYGRYLLDVNGSEVAVYGTHLSTQESKTAQLSVVVKAMGEYMDLPGEQYAILGGDMNAHVRDMAPVLDLERTVPLNGGEKVVATTAGTIDHIIVSKNFERYEEFSGLSQIFLNKEGSDHMAQYTFLKIPETDAQQ